MIDQTKYSVNKILLKRPIDIQFSTMFPFGKMLTYLGNLQYFDNSQL